MNDDVRDSAPQRPSAWHALKPEDAVAQLDAHADQGLTEADAARRLERHGPNEIESEEPFSWPAAVVRQVLDPLVLILLLAAVVSGVVGEVLDAVAIAAIVTLNAAVSFVQEWRAERALAALGGLVAPTSRVIRDGRACEIPASDVAPGDLVLLASGDRAPADVKLVEAAELTVDESALTGESAAVRKAAGADAGDAPLAARSTLVHAGTIVATGRGRGVAVATGSSTEFGRIASMAAAVRRAQTPLQRRLGRLGRTLGLLSIAIGVFLMGFGLAVGRSALEMFMTGVSLAVAAVPEGLPAVVALSLALGVRAMAKRNALIRRLRAAETLGSATVICADKTGTLTTGAMTVARLAVASGEIRAPFRATGSLDAEAAAALETAAICNDAGFDDAGRPVGSPTETALLAAARAAGVDAARGARRLSEAPFSSARKMMSVVVDRAIGFEAHIKGAPERVIAQSAYIRTGDERQPLDEDARTQWLSRAGAMAARGLRVIALARREGVSSYVAAQHEEDLELLGLAGLHDPPRRGARAAVEIARGAGVRVLMITGDAPETAAAIAREVGLEDGDVLVATELDAIEDSALTERLHGVSVLSRATPHHKLRIVERLQAGGEIVAMTGDGVNDAPALKKADIGVAMGVRGADAARAAADMVLLDDDFATIVAAMREGRRQDDNIRKFVAFLLASNLGEVIAVSSSILVGAPLMLLPVQILWMNLVTDGATALALGLERAEPDVMSRPPRAPGRPVLDRRMLSLVSAYGVVLAAIAIAFFHMTLGLGTALAQTFAFTALVVVQQAMVMDFRSLRSPLSRIGWASNPWLLAAVASAIVLQLGAVYFWPLTRALVTTPLPAWAWAAFAAVGLVFVGAAEAGKLFRSALARRRG
jgi:Ca2+-transporting ATPase